MLQRHAIELLEPEAGEDLNPGIQLAERMVERLALHRVCALYRRRILDAPVGGHRLTRPNRAHLVCGVAADGEYEIEPRGAGPRELVPALAAKPVDRQVVALENL